MISIQDEYSPEFDEMLPRLVMHRPRLHLPPIWAGADGASLGGSVAVGDGNLKPAATVVIPRGGNVAKVYLIGKRVCDILGASAAMLLLSPLLLGTLAVLIVTTRGNPFFRQRREGLCGRMFWMWKFRTMVVDAERRLQNVKNERGGAMFKNPHDPRITRFGKYLRKYSVDELPQLLNVLMGQMSLVGPRPMVVGHGHAYHALQLRRLSVKPGITGLWQVSGRTRLNFEQMVALDLSYVRRQSLRFDMKLLARTPWVVLVGHGAC